MSFVTCSLVGRLGNQCFEIANCLTVALDNNAEWLIPNVAGGSDCYFFHLPLFDPAIHKVENIHRERAHNYNPIPYRPNMKLEGFFQTEKYFKHRRKEVLEALKFPYEKKEGFVSLHIRRGDYVPYPLATPLVKMEYYTRAINFFKERCFNNFLVFSDDLQWAKDNLKQDANFSFSEETDAIKDMTLMSNCEHNIIANSSFSWWGAWLNQNPNKIVISPSKHNWFGVRTRLNMDDIVCKDWAQFKF